MVEDLSIIRKGCISALKKHNIYTIAEAENGQQLLEILTKKTPDLVLLDLDMPVLNGSKTLNILRKKYPELKIIILSQFHNEEVIKDMLNRGARAFISKSEGFDTLVSAIRSVKSIGLYKDNLMSLFSSESPKNRHWYKLIFTRREKQIIALLMECKTLAVIATELFLAEKTIQAHKTSIYKKAGVKNHLEFVKFSQKAGLQFLEAERDTE